MYEGMIAETIGSREYHDDFIEGYLARPLWGPFPRGGSDTPYAGLGRGNQGNGKETDLSRAYRPDAR